MIVSPAWHRLSWTVHKRVSVLDQCFYLHACVGYGLLLHFRIRPDVVAECYIRAFLDLFCCHPDTVAVTPVLASLLARKAKQSKATSKAFYPESERTIAQSDMVTLLAVRQP